MGEVYRADDLKLGQPVALKFLPEAVQKSEDRLRRFLDEVRLALRITHPNVCRVYDIGEVDSQHYISMEYVDGEDLASLLRRIGRLPQDRGVTVARQICAGLAAAHGQGILHRDLKPANIMIDGRGRARITDFGLAGFAGGAESREDRSGTPAYMAPEQLTGSAASERSDIYALGLILYEIFAGVPAFEAAASVEVIRQQRSSTPTSMSSHVPGLDAAIETAIMRALEPDPARRPASVLGLAAALPGGDPLAAALAAGETPSPEMVAGAATEVGLRKPVAIACLAVGLLSLLLVALAIPRHDLLALVPWKLTPTELSVRAQQVLRELGGPERPRVIRDGVIADEGYISWIRENDHSMTPAPPPCATGCAPPRRASSPPTPTPSPSRSTIRPRIPRAVSPSSSTPRAASSASAPAGPNRPRAMTRAERMFRSIACSRWPVSTARCSERSIRSYRPPRPATPCRRGATRSTRDPPPPRRSKGSSRSALSAAGSARSTSSTRGTGPTTRRVSPTGADSSRLRFCSRSSS
jgi:serine/threonine protein kinase